MTKPRKEFVYRPTASKDELKRRAKLVGLESLDNFDGLIAHALQGNTEPLCERIRVRRLSSEQRHLVAWLIGVVVQHGKAGRPKGSKRKTGPRAVGKDYDLLHEAAAELRKRWEEYRTKNQSKWVREAEKEKMLDAVIDARPQLKHRTDARRKIKTLASNPSRIRVKAPSDS